MRSVLPFHVQSSLGGCSRGLQLRRAASMTDMVSLLFAVYTVWVVGSIAVSRAPRRTGWLERAAAAARCMSVQRCTTDNRPLCTLPAH